MQKYIILGPDKRTERDWWVGRFALSIFFKVYLGDKCRSWLVHTWD